MQYQANRTGYHPGGFLRVLSGFRGKGIREHSGGRPCITFFYLAHLVQDIQFFLMFCLRNSNSPTRCWRKAYRGMDAAICRLRPVLVPISEHLEKPDVRNLCKVKESDTGAPAGMFPDAFPPKPAQHPKNPPK